MITKEIRNTIKGYIEGFIQGMVDEAKQNGFDPKQLRPIRRESKDADLKPFHESLLLIKTLNMVIVFAALLPRKRSSALKI